MSPPQAMPPRKSVPAPRPSAVARLRERIFSPNAIRTVSVAVFFAIWEYYGRRMDPIFMAPPSAIFEAALALIQSGLSEGTERVTERVPVELVVRSSVVAPRTPKRRNARAGRRSLPAIATRNEG